MSAMRFVSFLFLVSLCFTVVQSQIPIDAVSSASNTIRIDSGWAYSNKAVLYTYHKDSYLYHFMAYGLTEEKLDTVIRPDTPRVNICTLKKLLPNKTYYFTYAGGIKESWDQDNQVIEGSFKTDESTAIIAVSPIAKSNFFASVSAGQLILSGNMISGDEIKMLDLHGRTVFSAMVDKSEKSVFTLPNLSSGIYNVVRTSSQSGTSIQKVIYSGN